MGQHRSRQCDLAGGAACHLRAEQDVGADFGQRYETDLWIRARAATGPRTAKSFVIVLLVGDIQRAAVQTYQTPPAIPSAFRGFHRNRLHYFIVELPDQWRSQMQTLSRIRRPCGFACGHGSHPSLVRACEMPELPATLLRTDGSSNHCTPSNRQRNTSRYDDCIYKASAIT